MGESAHLQNNGFSQKVSQAGFSLLEALVAMSIASLAIGALYKVAGQITYSSESASEKTRAALLAHSILAEGIFAEDLLKTPSGSDHEMRWKITATPMMVNMIDGYSGKSYGHLSISRMDIYVEVDRRTFKFEEFKPNKQVSVVK